MSQTPRFLFSLFQVSFQSVFFVHLSNFTLGFEGMKICSTGFVRIDLLHLSKLVNLIGDYSPFVYPLPTLILSKVLHTMSI